MLKQPITLALRYSHKALPKMILNKNISLNTFEAILCKKPLYFNFSTENKNTESQTEKPQNEPHTQTQSQKQSQPQTQEESTNQKKLSQCSFEELIEIHTEESLTMAQGLLAKEEKKVTKNHETLEELSKQIEYLEKHAEQIKEKEAKLIENIEMQEDELKRVKVRAEKEVNDSKKYSISKIAKQLLEAADCINRCKAEVIKSYPDSEDSYIKNIHLTQQKMVEILKGFEIEQFDPINTAYDPNTQESLLQIPCPPGYTPGTVATTMRTGYLIQGRLLRSARVGIFSE